MASDPPLLFGPFPVRTSENIPVPPVARSDDGRDAQHRRKLSERKREWRRTRSPTQLKLVRDKDAERKRSLRKKMTPEERRIQREKDAVRKANARRKEAEDIKKIDAMCIYRFIS